MIRWFGSPWFYGAQVAPICEDLTLHRPTPWGEACGWCSELIVEGDRGVISPTMEVVLDQLVSTGRPMHAECWVRQGSGGPACLVGVCTCHAGPGMPVSADPDLGMGARDAARLVAEWVQAQGVIRP